MDRVKTERHHRRRDRRSAACRKRASSTSSAIPAARSSTSTTSSSSRTRSSTSWCATSRRAVHAADGYSRVDRQGRRRAGHLRPGRHQCGHRHRHRLHGLDPDGDHHRPGADARDRPGRVPGMRHRRHHAARASSTTSSSRTCSDLALDDEEGVPHRAAPAGPGPVLVDIPKDVTQATGASSTIPKTVAMRSYNPVTQGPRRPDQEGGAAAARRPKRPMIYTGGGVILGNASPRADASWSTCSASRAPTR